MPRYLIDMMVKGKAFPNRIYLHMIGTTAETKDDAIQKAIKEMEELGYKTLYIQSVRELRINKPQSNEIAEIRF